MRNLLLVVILSFFMLSCSDEFSLFNEDIELSGNEADNIILYANICQQNTTHFIRVNKGFVGGNFYDLANDFDQIQFSPGELNVRFQILNSEGGVLAGHNYLCKDTLVEKEEGDIFSTDFVRLYYFNEPELEDNPDYSYRIKVEHQNGQVVTAQTKPVSEFYLSSPLTQVNFDATSTSKITFRAREAIYGQVYSIDTYVTYREISQGRDTTYHTFVARGSDRVEPDYPVESPDELKLDVYLSSIFAKMIQHFEARGDVDVLKRELHTVYFSFNVGNNDMAMIISQGGVQSGFQTDYTIYGNVMNGYGFFTSFLNKKTDIFSFTPDTHEYMSETYFEYGF